MKDAMWHELERVEMPVTSQTIRDAVATADRETKLLQVDVVLTHYTVDGGGNVVSQTSTTWKALVEDRVRRFQTLGGVELLSRAKVTILTDVPIYNTQMSGSEHPDVILLPTGRSAPVLAFDKLMDPLAVKPGGGYLTEIWLGAGGRS